MIWQAKISIAFLTLTPSPLGAKDITMKIQLTVLILFFVSTTCIGQPFEELGKHYSQGDFDFVIDKGRELLDTKPDEPVVNMLVGRALADKGDFQNAIPYLDRAAESQSGSKWINSWSLGYLGSCYFMNGQFEKAKESLQKSLDLNATRNSNKYASRRTLLFGTDSFYSNWTTDSTEQIIFHFQNESELEKESFMNLRQKALENILTSFPAELPKKIDFFVWESEQDAMKILQTNLGFSDPGYLITHSRKNQTKGHELTHIVIEHSFHPNSKSRFINEGIATLHDQTNRNRVQLAKKALSEFGQDVIIEDLWRNGRSYSEKLVYSVGAVWMAYCSEKLSNEQLRTLLKNQTYDEALELLGVELTNTMTVFEKELLEN